MQILDWSIILTFIVILMCFAFWTKRYCNSVADFLSANRCGGRYMLTMAEGMAGMGTVGIAAWFESVYQAGFCTQWWGYLYPVVFVLLSVSGWVIYRFRETRALTMAQFFEMRYSRKFRIFAAIVAWSSGIVNYGIFPIITARMIIYLTGMPISVHLVGLTIPTHAIIMAIMLSIAVFMAFAGGQIVIMVTDFLQGTFTNIIFLAVAVYVFWRFGWTDIRMGLESAAPGESLVNPFNQQNTPDFNIIFYAIQAFIILYGYMAWQGSQGFNSAAKNPHEARMARVLASWRCGMMFLMLTVLPIVVFAIFHNPKFSALASSIQGQISQIADPQIQKQMTVTLGIRNILPSGLIGLMCVVFISAAMATDESSLHSWGSIFIQDIVMPLRKSSLSPRAHMLLLRLSILGVALFAFCFGLVFPLKDYIYMFCNITGAIFIGGAGSVIIGGLYWKRGTTAGAFAGMITGTVLAVVAIALQSVIWPYLLPGLKANNSEWLWLQRLPVDFPINGTTMSFFVSIAAILIYVVGSLLSKNANVDMDKLLHRGKYAVEGEKSAKDSDEPIRGWKTLFVVGKEFTLIDKVICYATVGWMVFNVLARITMGILARTFGFSDRVWSEFWFYLLIVIGGILALITTIWFLIGGFHDMFEMFGKLKSLKRDAQDDGWVDDHSKPVDKKLIENVKK